MQVRLCASRAGVSGWSLRPLSGVGLLTYRVSIKSFPDYKHLLQGNYMEYKHIFLPLLKVVSKILCHVFIVMLLMHNYKFEGKNNRRFCYNN